MKNYSTKLIPDKIFSTYWWVIVLDHSHPDNNNKNVAELTGYSKFQGHDEARDKNNLLMSKIVMLVNNGYLKKSHKIDIYRKSGGIINKNESIKVISLFPNDYEYPDNLFMAHIESDFIRFMDNLYNSIRTGQVIKKLVPKQDMNFSKDDYFNINKHHFKTRNELYQYCEKLVKSGHPFGQIQNFCFKYTNQNKF